MVSKTKIEQLLQTINQDIDHLENALQTTIEQEKTNITTACNDMMTENENRIAEKMANLEKTLFDLPKTE